MRGAHTSLRRLGICEQQAFTTKYEPHTFFCGEFRGQKFGKNCMGKWLFFEISIEWCFHSLKWLRPLIYNISSHNCTDQKSNKLISIQSFRNYQIQLLVYQYFNTNCHIRQKIEQHQLLLGWLFLKQVYFLELTKFWPKVVLSFALRGNLCWNFDELKVVLYNP